MPLYWEPFDYAAPISTPEPWGPWRTCLITATVWVFLILVAMAPWLLLAWILNQ